MNCFFRLVIDWVSEWVSNVQGPSWHGVRHFGGDLTADRLNDADKKERTKIRR